ncbi:MAG: glycosyltransferase family 39 protein [Gemmatimonadota bacterium]
MRQPARWAAAGVVVGLLAALALFDLRLFIGGDNAYYIALTRALATGRGYVDLIAPADGPHTQYPPGFPLLLVPAWWLGGGALFVLKLVSWVAAGFALAGTWALARRDPAVPPWAAAAAVWLLALYPVFLAYAHWTLSEMTFVAVSMWALWALLRSGDDDRWNGAWLAGCLLALGGFAVRTAGITLIAAAVAWALLRRRWRRAGVAAAVAALGVIPWILWSAQNPPPTGGYLEQVRASNPYDPASAPLGAGAVLGRAAQTVVHYALLEFPRLFWPFDGELPYAVRAFGFLLGGALLAIGVWRAIRARGIQTWDLHTFFALGMILIWPWRGDRFFLTIAPFVWLYLLVGLEHVARSVLQRAIVAQVTVAALALFLLIGGMGKAPEVWEINRRHLDGEELAGYTPFWRDYFEAARWIGENAPDAVIVARKPTFAWYWSGGRPAFVYPFRTDYEATWRMIREQGATHVLFDPGGATATYLIPALQGHLDSIEAVHAAPNRLVYVLRIAPRPRPTPPDTLGTP